MRRTPAIKKFIFAINAALLLLLIVSWPYYEAGSGARVVAVLAAIPIALTFLILGGLSLIEADIFDW